MDSFSSKLQKLEESINTQTLKKDLIWNSKQILRLKLSLSKFMGATIFDEDRLGPPNEVTTSKMIAE